MVQPEVPNCPKDIDLEEPLKLTKKVGFSEEPTSSNANTSKATFSTETF